jgi:hypothetical protein
MVVFPQALNYSQLEIAFQADMYLPYNRRREGRVFRDPHERFG